jgi:dephospho-CoA kinase
MIILGITGTLGAGKGTIVDYLVQQKGFSHFSVRAFLLEKIRERELPENRDSMYRLANDLRTEFGASYVTDCLYAQAEKAGKNSIIESIRTTGEISSLRKNRSFYLIAVDASPEIRFHRIRERQSETDDISFETFLADEQRETGSGDPGKQDLRACMAMADFLVMNNGTIEELDRQVDSILEMIRQHAG